MEKGQISTELITLRGGLSIISNHTDEMVALQEELKTKRERLEELMGECEKKKSKIKNLYEELDKNNKFCKNKTYDINYNNSEIQRLKDKKTFKEALKKFNKEWMPWWSWILCVIFLPFTILALSIGFIFDYIPARKKLKESLEKEISECEKTISSCEKAINNALKRNEEIKIAIEKETKQEEKLNAIYEENCKKLAEDQEKIDDKMQFFLQNHKLCIKPYKALLIL